MPGDMAMQRPSTGIVSCELDHDVGVSGDELNVASLRVCCVGESLARVVAGVRRAGCEDEEIVSVEMHGVGGEGWVVDYEAYGGVGAEVVDVPLKNLVRGRGNLA